MVRTPCAHRLSAIIVTSSSPRRASLAIEGMDGLSREVSRG